MGLRQRLARQLAPESLRIVMPEKVDRRRLPRTREEDSLARAREDHEAIPFPKTPAFVVPREPDPIVPPIPAQESGVPS
jgi:hypothetical protein